jgi:hypothetical protein
MLRKLYNNFCALSIWKKLIVLFLLFFPIRFIFGICSEFWFDDEVQIYLIGVKFYAGGYWPFFGPDVIYTSSQIPGALQGLLVGLPFYILPIPESPYILLNILTFISLFFLAYYVKKYHTPDIPEWFLWIWIYTAPWVMNFSTHVVNPSYVLPAAILFLVSFLETMPSMRKGFINYRLSFLFMGFSLFWIFQLHMSWILLLPFICISFYFTLKNRRYPHLVTSIYFLAGCLISASLVIPTFLKYGFASGSGNTSSNVIFNLANAGEILTIPIRMFSLASFEVSKFIGGDTKERILYLTENIWAAPFNIFAMIIGGVQMIWLTISLFRKNNLQGWKTIRILMVFAIIITYISFLFSVKGPSTHTFYLMLPLAMIYSFYCWHPSFKKKCINVLAGIFILSSLIFHVSLGLYNYKFHSMYMNRKSPLEAIVTKNFFALNNRRSFDRNKPLLLYICHRPQEMLIRK